MILFFILTLFVIFLIWKMKFLHIQGLHRGWLISSFILKILVGFALWWVYSSYYEIDRSKADIFKYYDDGAVVASAMDQSSSVFFDVFFDKKSESTMEYYEKMFNWDRARQLIPLNDNRTMIRINAVMHLLTGGRYHLHSLLFVFLSFVGLVLLYKGMLGFAKLPPWMFIVACVIPPSLLFWASGIMKECLVMLPLGMMIYGLDRWVNNGRSPLLFVISIILLFGIKPYILLSVIPGILFILLDHFSKLSVIRSFILSHVFVLGVVFFASYFPRTDLVEVLSLERAEFIRMAEDTDAGSAISIPMFDSLVGLIIHAPSAVFRTYMRPFFLEGGSVFELLSGMENLMYLLLFILLLFFRRKSPPLRAILLVASIVLTLGIFIGSVTPVLGAIVRYKSPGLPFLLILIYLLIDSERINAKLKSAFVK